MQITPQAGQQLGSTVTGFDLGSAAPEQLAELRDAVYQHRILVLKDQRLTPEQFIALGQAFGEIEVYYEKMYHHGEHPEIFVSGSNPAGDAEGVPQTGRFWHADYSFMPRPFGITMTYPQLVPTRDRGTYFVDMTRVFASLSPEVQQQLRPLTAVHSPRRYFKIRPTDVYRPIGEIQDEIERTTPAVHHPAVFRHPYTGEEVLYVSEAGTCELLSPDGRNHDDLLKLVLEASGQLDTTFTHERIHLQRFVRGDLLVWDNRALIHRALHTTQPEPTLSYRVTVNDDRPFYEGIAA